MCEAEQQGRTPEDVGSGTAPAMVIFVVAREAVCHQLRAAIERLVAARIVIAATVLDAMLRVARVPADLMVIDLSHDASHVPALLRHLARVDARTEVLLFDEVDGPEQRDMYTVRPWHDAEAALHRWCERFVRGVQP